MISIERTITHQNCAEGRPLPDDELQMDKTRSSFILQNKFRRIAGRRRLGVLWIGLDPVIRSIIYLFVLTVLRSSIKGESLFIGITLWAVLGKSFKSGCASVADYSGGIMAERIRTRALIPPIIKFRIIESFASTIGAALVLAVYFGVDLLGVVGFLIIGQTIGILFEGLGQNVAMMAKRVPDINNIINHFLRFMFYASPVLYPMTLTSGVHYRLNEWNPFTYFVELSRKLAGLDSVYDDLNLAIFLVYLVVLIVMAFRGFGRIDRNRWELSSWS